MADFMNHYDMQQQRHDIEPGHYMVEFVRAYQRKPNRSCIEVSVHELTVFMGFECRIPMFFAPHEPLVDALWEFVHRDNPRATRGNLITKDAWVVELGKNGKVLGFARATVVFGLGDMPWAPTREAPDHEVYFVEEMRRKGHRY
jgi:hypothetical protein